MDRGWDRVVAAALAEASRLQRRRVRSTRNDAPAPIKSREGDAVNETTTEPTPARADVLRDRALELIAEAFDDDDGIQSGISHQAAVARWMARAANDLDQIARRADAAAPVAPAINVERLAADVWQVAQTIDVLSQGGLGDHAERGIAATAIADVAVAALRKVLS